MRIEQTGFIKAVFVKFRCYAWLLPPVAHATRYPPVDRDEVYKEIFEQAENFKKYQKGGAFEAI